MYFEAEDGLTGAALVDYFEKMQKIIFKKYGLSTRISIGGEKDLAEIFASYEESNYNLAYGRKNLEIFTARHAMDQDILEFMELQEKVYAYFIEKDSRFTTILKRLVSLYEPLLDTQPERVIRALIETYILIYKIAAETNIVSKDLYRSKSYLDQFLDQTPLGKIVEFDKQVRILFKRYNDLESTNYSEITIRAIALIESKIREPISLEEAAKEIGVTPQYLSRIFKIDTAKSFKSYHKNLRMEEAKRLLREDEMSVREISDALGFNDYNYFIRTFKKTVGCTPTEYKG